MHDFDYATETCRRCGVTMQQLVASNCPPEEYPCEPKVKVPDKVVFEPLVLYRAWRIVPLATVETQVTNTTKVKVHNRIALMGMFDNVWEWGANKAACGGWRGRFVPQEHEAPEPMCSCGFYGLYSPPVSIRDLIQGPDTVLGAVLGWGKVIKHTFGARVQYAQIIGLTLSYTASILRQYLTEAVEEQNLDISFWDSHHNLKYAYNSWKEGRNERRGRRGGGLHREAGEGDSDGDYPGVYSE